MAVAAVRFVAWAAAALSVLGPLPRARAEESLGPARMVARAAFAVGGREIKSGQRVERDAEGVLWVADESFPGGGEAHGVPLPESLGGGVLFHQTQIVNGDNTTAFYRGREWTGALEPLGSLPVVVEQVRVGFDRLYLSTRSGWIAFDPLERKVVSLGALPRVASFEGLAFSSGSRAAFVAPLVGAFGTENAGLDWRPLEGVTAVEGEEGIVLVTERGKERWLDDGQRQPLSVASGPTAERLGSEVGRIERALQYGRRDGDHVDALLGGEWIEVDDAKGIRVRRHPLASDPGSCGAVPRSGPAWFSCTRGDTRLVELLDGKVVERARFTGARRLLASGKRGLLLERGCQGEPGVCLVTLGATDQVGLDSRTVLGVEREAAVGVVGNQLLGVRVARAGGAGGRLQLEVRRLDQPGRPLRRYSVPADGEITHLLAEGSLLPELIETKEGLGVWLTRGEEFVGLVLGEGAEVSSGPIQRRLRRAVFAGERAMVWGAAGFAKETLDGGLTWNELAFPFRSGDGDLDVPDGRAEVTMGCGRAGCRLGRMLRFGWGAAQANGALPNPERVPVPPPGGGRFRFECTARGRAHTADGETFFGQKDDLGAKPGAARVSVDAVDELGRLVAAGPPGIGWTRDGRAQLLFRDPFDGRIRKTRVTQGLFADALRAEEALGKLEPANSSAVIELEASGRGGFLLVASRAHTELFTFAEDEPIERVSGAAELGLRRLQGAARVAGVWYTGQRSRDGFTVLRVKAGGLEELVTLPLGLQTPGQTEVVAGSLDQLGVATDGDSGLFVYGLDDHGRLGAPMILPHGGAHPRACSADQPGFVVARDLAITPYIERGGAPLDLSRVAARYRIGPGWACMEALSARTRGMVALQTPSSRSTPAMAGSVALEIPLAIVDLGSGQGVDSSSCR